jgi:hypothetical protein
MCSGVAGAHRGTYWEADEPFMATAAAEAACCSVGRSGEGQSTMRSKGGVKRMFTPSLTHSETHYSTFVLSLPPSHLQGQERCGGEHVRGLPHDLGGDRALDMHRRVLGARRGEERRRRSDFTVRLEATGPIGLRILYLGEGRRKHDV